MEVEFRVGVVVRDTTACGPVVCRWADELSGILSGLEYRGTTRRANSTQLDVHFDAAFIAKLRSQQRTCEVEPFIDTNALGAEWGRVRADVLVTRDGAKEETVALEIEKANMWTIWFDLIKLWMFIETA